MQDLEAETEKDEKQAREEMDQTPDMDTNMDLHCFNEQVLYFTVLYQSFTEFIPRLPWYWRVLSQTST